MVRKENKQAKTHANGREFWCLTLLDVGSRFFLPNPWSKVCKIYSSWELLKTFTE